MKICFRCTQLLIHAFTCVYMLASGCFPCVPGYAHHPVYTIASPDGRCPQGEEPSVQSSSSDFTLMMLFVW